MSGQASGKILYFIKRYPAGNGIIYRVLWGQLEGSTYRGRGKWTKDEDIIRRYLNGFDADVDCVTEQEALEEMKRIDMEQRDDSWAARRLPGDGIPAIIFRNQTL